MNLLEEECSHEESGVSTFFVPPHVFTELEEEDEAEH